MTEDFHYKNILISVLKGDITEIQADAIVNAANKYLKHGGGVAAAIVQKGGKEIQRESNKIISEYGPLEVGEAVATTAGRLKAKKIIHTVGPIYGEGCEREKLIKATTNSLRIADRMKLKSIAFPAISTGIYRVPVELAADAMVNGILEYFENVSDTNIEKVILVLYSSSIYEVFLDTLKKKLK